MIAAGVLTVMGGLAIFVQSQQDKYAVMVPGGIAFSDFKGYEDWQPAGASFTDATSVIRLMVANPVMIGHTKKVFPEMGSPSRKALRLRRLSCLISVTQTASRQC
jgi:hypothetical protein